jgi:flagellar protein FlgJ
MYCSVFADTTDVFIATTLSILNDRDMATKAERLDFVRAVYPAARDLWEKQDSIHPLFVTAQAALETGWKLSGADETNNLFGITKGSRWKGETKLCLTREVFSIPDKVFVLPERVKDVTMLAGGKYEYRLWRLFRVYASLEACLDDHLSILRGPGYADAWPYRNDPKEYARRISDSVGAKYATDPSYDVTMRTMIGMIECYVKELRL